MKSAIVVREVAEKDMSDVFDWYDDQSPGLGAEFIAAVETLLDRIANNSAICQVVMGNVRRGVVQRFPYCVYYRIHPTHVEVIGVLHGSRDPATWQSRL